MGKQNITWQDIFDLLQEGIDEMKGSFLGNNDVVYDFEAKWNEAEQNWEVKFWNV